MMMVVVVKVLTESPRKEMVTARPALPWRRLGEQLL